MHFKTPNEVLEFIKEHAIEGTIVKDPYQERISKTAFKYMGENYGEAITYIHCKYKDMLMYDRALKQFQEDINYGQLEEMSYNERFAFLFGFETSLKAIESLANSQRLFEERDIR